MYADGCPIYFTEKDGKISVPEEYAEQAMGGEMLGYELYAKIAKSSTYAENKYTIVMEIIGKDAAGVKDDISFGEYTEVIDAEQTVPATSIDEMCGEYMMSATEYFDNVPVTVPVTITKVSETEAILSGIYTETEKDTYGMDYDDQIVLQFEDGQFVMLSQELEASLGGVYDIIARVIGSVNGDEPYVLGNTSPYLGKLTETGCIKFVDDAQTNAPNGVVAFGIGLQAIQNGQSAGLLCAFRDIRLVPADQTTSKASYSSNGGLKKDFKELNFTPERRDNIKSFRPKQAGKPIAKQSFRKNAYTASVSAKRSNFVEL